MTAGWWSDGPAASDLGPRQGSAYPARMKFLGSGWGRRTCFVAPFVFGLVSCGKVIGQGRDPGDAAGGQVGDGDGDSTGEGGDGSSGDGDTTDMGGDGEGSGGDQPTSGDGDGTGGDSSPASGGSDNPGSGGQAGVPPKNLSCADETGDECQAESCCATILLPGGRFELGRSEVSGASDYYPSADPNETPEVTVSLGATYLDKYEVTVGRFRAFVEQYEGEPPANNSGAAPGDSASGWSATYNDYIAPNQDALISLLHCDPDDDQLESWTDEPGDQELYPINCIDWWTAFQFCVWDGGRLPTEAEWEFAAAGGSENRLYPWGPQEPTCSRASLDNCLTGPYFLDVGSLSLGEGAFGHMDLAGGVYEWVLDRYTDGYLTTLASMSALQEDPVDMGDEDWRTIRSSHMFSSSKDARNTSRQGSHPVFLDHRYGVRCARDSL